MSNLLSATIGASGNSITLVWDTSETYSAGQVTLRGAPKIGMTSSLAATLGIVYERELATTGSPTSGDGTDTHVYDLADGFIAWEGETIVADVPAGFVSGGTEQTDVAVTNNADKSTYTECQGAPMFRANVFDTKFYTDTDLTIYVDAQGLAGEGNGVTSVAVAISDGVNSDLTDSATTMSDISKPDGDPWRCYVLGPFDLSDLDDGDIDFNFTVTSNCGLGTRTKTITANNNASDTQQTGEYWVEGTSGSNGNSGTSGSPWAQIGYALNQSRLAGDDICIINVAEAGTYNMRDGTSGVLNPADTKIQATVSGVVIRGADATEVNPYITSTNVMWLTSADPSSYQMTLNLAATDDDTTIVRIRHDMHADEGLHITHGKVDCENNGGIYYALQAGNSYSFYGTTFGDIYVFAQDAPSAENNWSEYWFITMDTMLGDPFNNARTIIGSTILSRDKGVPIFTVAYTGGGSATIERTGFAYDQPGTKNLILSVNSSPVLTMNLENASYDTDAEIIAAIDALTDWSCSASASAGRFPSDNIYPFDEVAVTSTPLQIYSRGPFHSDLYQNWSGITDQDIYINGIYCTYATGLGEGPGNIGEQTWWLDHAGPLNINGLLMMNIVDPFFLGGSAPIPRAAYHGVQQNCLTMFNTLPDTRISFNYDGGPTSNSEFTPTNFFFCYNIVHHVISEGAGTTPGSSPDTYMFSNHYQSTGIYEQITGDASTNGDIESLLTAFDSANKDYAGMDLTPDSSTLEDRVAMEGVVDVYGDGRNALGAIGAAAEAGAGVTAPTMPADDAVDVDENTTTVDTFTASAGDAPITYSLSGTDAASFSINSSTGAVIFDPDAPNYEVKDTYAFNVVATNSAGSDSQQITVNVQDVAESPTDIALSNASVSQGGGSNAVVGTLSTTDEDVGDSHTYSLVSGTGDTDNGSFNISGNQLRCTDPSALGTGEYSVRIQSTDGVSTPYQEAFTITVTAASSSGSTNAGTIRSTII